MNQALAGQLAQDPRDRAIPAPVLLRNLRSGRQGFAGHPRPGRQPAPQALLAALLALITGLAVARRITRPVARLITVTRAMASGDYSQRVTATAQDEVGSLARSFNTMASKLEQVESQRRELVANVSHELRTPIAALRARRAGRRRPPAPLRRSAAPGLWCIASRKLEVPQPWCAYSGRR